MESEYGNAQEVRLLLPVEPSAVDRFVDELRSLSVRKDGTAHLDGDRGRINS